MSRLLVAQRALTVPGWAKDALWRRAQAIPSLDLRFADNKSLVDAVTGASLVTFTRASSGTFTDSAGVLQTASTDVPRFDHNPTTGESLGLLVEEQRSNLFLQSEDLLTTWTANAGLSRTANQVVAPNGFTTADLLASNGTLIGYLEQPNASSNQFVSGTTYSYSVYLKKANTSTCLTLLFGTTFNSGGGNPVVTWNLDTGVPTFVNGATGSMTAVGNGWYRCVITDTATQTHTQNQQWLRMASADGDVYAWGAQLEQGASPTSYIPTTTAAATRSADVASISGSNFSSWYRQDEGTVFVEFIPNVSGSASGPGVSPGLLAFNDAAGSGFRGRSSRLSLNGAASIRWGSRVSSTIVELASAIHNSFLAAGQTYKAGFLYGNAFLAGSINASISEVSDTNYSSIVVADQMQIGVQSIGGTPTQLNGTLKRLSFWPARLPKSTLQTLTQ